MNKKILVIAAHPSDEIMGCGGTIAKYTSNGYDVHILILCKSPNMFYDKSKIILIKEQAIGASKLLKIKELKILNFPNSRLNVTPMIDIVKAIRKEVDRIKPDLIYTHHRGDIHADHKITFDATIAATRSFGDNIVKKILCYEVPSSSFWAPPFVGYCFVPNVFSDISNTIETKNKAFRKYKTELRQYPHTRSIKALMMNAEVWGIKMGLPYVEAFELVRDVF